MAIVGKERMCDVDVHSENKLRMEIEAMLRRQLLVFSGREKPVNISGGSRERELA